MFSVSFCRGKVECDDHQLNGFMHGGRRDVDGRIGRVLMGTSPVILMKEGDCWELVK